MEEKLPLQISHDLLPIQILSLHQQASGLTPPLQVPHHLQPIPILSLQTLSLHQQTSRLPQLLQLSHHLQLLGLQQKMSEPLQPLWRAHSIFLLLLPDLVHLYLISVNLQSATVIRVIALIMIVWTHPNQVSIITVCSTCSSVWASLSETCSVILLTCLRVVWKSLAN